MLAEHKKKINTALKKIKGMIKKLETMVEEEKYCGEIIQQLKATNGILKNIGKTVLANHIRCCGPKKLSSNNNKEKESFIQEIFRVIDINNSL